MMPKSTLKMMTKSKLISIIFLSLIEWGCSPFKIVIPPDFAGTEVKVPITIKHRRLLWGEVTEQSMIIEPFQVKDYSSDEVIRDVKRTSKRESAVREVYNYSFSLVDSSADRPPVEVSCVTQKRYIEERESKIMTSIEDEEMKTSCELAEAEGEAGFIVLDHTQESSEVTGALLYANRQYDYESIHHVIQWSFPRSTPYGFELRFQETLIGAVQLIMPEALYLMPELSPIDRKVISLFSAIVLLEHQIGSSFYAPRD
jgi:hypothetical protein